MEDTGIDLWIQHRDAIPKVKLFISSLLSHQLEELEGEVRKMEQEMPKDPFDDSKPTIAGYNSAIRNVLSLINSKK